MKVIKVDDFKKAFCDTDCFENFHVDFDGKVYVDITSFLNFLDTMPTIEAEPVRHGKWIDAFMDAPFGSVQRICECSNCKNIILR